MNFFLTEFQNHKDLLQNLESLSLIPLQGSRIVRFIVLHPYIGVNFEEAKCLVDLVPFIFL